MARVSAAEIIISGNVKQLNQALKRIDRNFNQLKRRLDSVSAGADRIASSATRGLLALGAATAAPINAFRETELGIAKVGKTTGLAGKELQDLGKELINLRLPLRNKEVLEMAHVAGQLGIKGSANISKFTETMGKLAFATNVTGEEGAKSIARILGLVDEGIDTVDTFSNVLVRLGNNAKANETEILEQASALAQNLVVYEANSAQILALATTFAELDLNSQAAGTAMQLLGKTMSEELISGSEKGHRFAEIMGMTLPDALATFKEDGFDAMKTFIMGLEEMDNQGIVLKELGLNQVRAARAMLSAAVRSEQWRKNTMLVNDELAKQNALNNEFNRIMDTFDGQIKNAVKDLEIFATRLGGMMVRSWRAGIDSVFKFVEGLKTMDENTMAIIIAFAEFGVKVLALAAGLAIAVSVTVKLYTAYMALSVLLNKSIFKALVHGRRAWIFLTKTLWKHIAAIGAKIKAQVASIALEIKQNGLLPAIAKGIKVITSLTWLRVAAQKALNFATAIATAKILLLVGAVIGLVALFAKLTGKTTELKIFFSRIKEWIGMDGKSGLFEDLSEVEGKLADMKKKGDESSKAYKDLINQRKMLRAEIGKEALAAKGMGETEVGGVSVADPEGPGKKIANIEKDQAKVNAAIQASADGEEFLKKRLAEKGWKATAEQQRILGNLTTEQRKAFYKSVNDSIKSGNEQQAMVMKEGVDAEIAIQNLRLEYEARYGEKLSETQQNHLNLEIERIRAQREKKLEEFELTAEQNEFLNTLDTEQRVAYQEHLLQMQEDFANQKLQKKIEEDKKDAELKKKRFEMEKKYGKDMMWLGELQLKHQEFVNKVGQAEYQKATQTFAAMQNSRFSILRAAGKAQALYSLGVDSIEATGASFKYGTKVGGHFTGMAFAALTAAWYAEQFSNLAKAAEGGTIMGGPAGEGDPIPIRVNRQETIIPKGFRQEVMDAVATKRLEMEKMAAAPAPVAPAGPSITINGDVFDSQETGTRILEMIANQNNFNNVTEGSFAG